MNNNWTPSDSDTSTPLEQTTKADTAKEAVDSAAAKAERVIEASRHKVDAAHDAVDAKIRSLADDVKPAIDAISASLERLAQRSKNTYSHTTETARATVHDYADKTSSYVSDKPLQSVAIAAAAGAALALLLGRRR